MPVIGNNRNNRNNKKRESIDLVNLKNLELAVDLVEKVASYSYKLVENSGKTNDEIRDILKQNETLKEYYNLLSKISKKDLKPFGKMFDGNVTRNWKKFVDDSRQYLEIQLESERLNQEKIANLAKEQRIQASINDYQRNSIKYEEQKNREIERAIRLKQREYEKDFDNLTEKQQQKIVKKWGSKENYINSETSTFRESLTSSVESKYKNLTERVELTRRRF